MSKIKLISQGYTLKVVSCENDGDYYSTKFHTIDTIEEARALKHMCENLFISRHDKRGTGVGNSSDQNCLSQMSKYIEDNPFLFNPELNTEDCDEIYDAVTDYSHVLMGSSDFYDVRICVSCVITYSGEDIYGQEIL